MSLGQNFTIKIYFEPLNVPKYTLTHTYMKLISFIVLLNYALTSNKLFFFLYKQRNKTMTSAVTQQHIFVDLDILVLYANVFCTKASVCRSILYFRRETSLLKTYSNLYIPAFHHFLEQGRRRRFFVLLAGTSPSLSVKHRHLAVLLRLRQTPPRNKLHIPCAPVRRQAVMRMGTGPGIR